MFIVGASSVLLVKDLEERHVINSYGPVTFLECTQLCKFKQFCNGNLITFNIRRGNGWRLGIVQSIFPMDYIPCANIFVWTGTLKMQGTPMFATGLGCKKWTDITHHFTFERFEPSLMVVCRVLYLGLMYLTLKFQDHHHLVGKTKEIFVKNDNQ